MQTELSMHKSTLAAEKSQLNVACFIPAAWINIVAASVCAGA
jgi:hypothetical protein